MIRRIRKRDGREVPFDKAKIADAVARAQSAVGERDAQFAGEVADVVEMALLRRYPDGRFAAVPGSSGGPGAPEDCPGIEEIQDLVEQALIELGRAAVAKAYILYRDRRARIRSALHVASAGSGAGDRHAGAGGRGADADKRAPRVQLATGVSAWSKGRIVVALMNEADLPRASAEEIAARVETRVFDSGLKRISTALIRELVDNELVELGLAQALRRQRPVGLPRHDLRAILAGDPPSEIGARTTGELFGPASVEDAIASEILRRYALEDVLGDAAAELHLAGDIDLEDLARPHLVLSQSIPCDLVLSGDPGPQAAFALLGELAGIAGRCASGVVLEDAGTLVHALLRGTRGAARASPLAHWIAALTSLACASGKRFDLCLPPSAAGRSAPARDEDVARGAARTVGLGVLAAHARLIEELDQVERDGARGAPRLFLDGGDLLRLVEDAALLRPACDRLLAAGVIVPTFGVAGERFAAPGIARGLRERGALACGAAVAINLPRAARRAGPWREDALLENLALAVEGALEALAALQRFQRSIDAREARGPRGPRGNGPRGRVGYVLVPVGLREALRWLGDGELRPEQGARILAFLVEAAQRFGAARALHVTVTPFFGARAAARFAAQDAELFQVSQPLLFGDEARGDERGAPYSCGFDLGPAQPGLASALGAGEAALLASVRSGAIHPARILARATPGEPLAALAQFERLERMRERLRSGAHALYALPTLAVEDGGIPSDAGLYAAPEPDSDSAGEPDLACAASRAPEDT